MKDGLSLVMITKNSSGILEESLNSALGLANEIIIDDDHSTDETRLIAKRFGAKIINNTKLSFGKRRQRLLAKATFKWIFALDPDEKISPGLKKEIKRIIGNKQSVDGYEVYFQNHYLGKKISRGGENYKLIRLFKNGKGEATSSDIHETYILKSKNIGLLKNKILHYSYRSFFQMISKFTTYSLLSARQKSRQHEKTSLKKIFVYPIHMFYSRYIVDYGYKDGLFRLPLDLGFAYMEFLTYIFLFFYQRNKKI